MTVQTREILDKELHSVERDLLRISDLVKIAIRRSTKALVENDTELAHQVIVADDAINDLRFAIEQECMIAVATQQPMASDLRELISGIVIVTELERMGDHAAGNAKIALWLEDEPHISVPKRLLTMVDNCVEMLEQVLDAFTNRDAETARAVAARDDEVDRLHRELFDELVSSTLANERTSNAALNQLFAAHNIERIGDRITNIAERVIFVAEGKLEELNVSH